MIVCDNLVKIYKIADIEVVALQGLDLTVAAGEFMALVGASGSGKTTLLNLLGGLDEPSAGRLQIAGRDMLQLNEKERVHYRQQVVGFLWQQPSRNLLPYLTAWENVALPLVLGGKKARKERAMALLEMVGLADRAMFRPDRLSGGQQQRVGLAVALANNPALLLADEPTGQVDSATADSIFALLRQIHQANQTTVIIVTHDQRVVNKVDRVVAIRDGRITTEVRRQQTGQHIEEEEWVVLDRSGRLHLPAAYVQALDLRERVKLRLEDNFVAVWPGQKNGSGREPIAKPAAQSAKAGPTFHSGQIALQTHQLTRIYETGNEPVRAVNEVSLTIPAGQMAVVKGPSGSGKTTLLNLIAGLDEPSSGRVLVNGQDLAAMKAPERLNLRRQALGFVFQSFGLLPYLTARENIETALRLVKAPAGERQQRSQELLDLVGLSGRANHRVHELSGGEQQRIALARALANRPGLVLADEPTGQLDTATGHDIIALLRHIIGQTGVTILIASHDPKVEAAADLVYELRDGQLVT